MNQNSIFEKTFIDLLLKLNWDIIDPLLVYALLWKGSCVRLP